MPTPSTRTFLAVFLTLTAACLNAAFAKSDIRLTHPEQAFLPGDLVEIDVSIETALFAHPELKIPRHPNLQPIAAQSLPFQATDKSGYTYRWRLIYQTVQSGALSLEGGSIALAEQTFDLNPLAIEVAALSDEADHDSVEPLPNPTRSAIPSGPTAFILVFAVGILVGIGIILFLRRRKSTADTQQPSNSNPFRAALSSIRHGTSDPSQLERFLRDYRQQCSPRLIAALERATYSKSANTSDLANAIDKEAAR